MDVHGKVNASHFIGDGASLTNLDASKITTGKLALDRLPDGIVVASGGNTTFTGKVGIGANPNQNLTIYKPGTSTSVYHNIKNDEEELLIGVDNNAVLFQQ